MKKKNKGLISWKNKQGRIAPFFFVFTILLMVYFFPKTAKFRFEYKVGEPWLHENLIADFDFPIYKLPEQIKKEQNLALNKVLPIYFRRPEVEQKLKSSFHQDFEKWILLQDTLISPEKKNSILSKYETILAFIYEKGILNFSADVDLNSLNNISIRKDQLVEEQSVDSFFTLKTAYQKLKNTDSIMLTEHESAVFQFENYIRANFFYDKTLTEKARNEAINSVIPTRGIVKRNERIVFRGEIIDEQTFVVLESLRREYELEDMSNSKMQMLIAGQFLFVSLIMAVLFMFLYFFRLDIYKQTKNVIFILLLVILGTFFGVAASQIAFVSVYLAPLTIVAIMLRVFFDARLGLIVFILLSILVGYFAPDSYEFVVVQTIAGMAAVVSLNNLYRRIQLIITAFFIVLAYILAFLAFQISQSASLADIQYFDLLWFVANGFLVLLSYVFIYMFERIFGFLSDITLLELSDANQNLLKKVSEQAPGTFQHSLQVANLAEEGIRQIGGNTLLIRAGALYHDIGKMKNPYYFTENQPGDDNPHDALDDNIESAKIIISHVSQGVEMGRKNRLPNAIIDFMRTHHGDSLVRYFYIKQKERDPETKAEQFRYPGPKPFTKEQAVLMMADSTEAASRSLVNPDKENITKLVNGIIDYQLSESQFDNSDITYKDIRILKETFIKKLSNIYHKRISYPKDEK